MKQQEASAPATLLEDAPSDLLSDLLDAEEAQRGAAALIQLAQSPGERRAALREALFLDMATTERVAVAHLRRDHGAGFTEVEFGLAFHDARERLRKERCVEFTLLRGHPGVLVRATEQQKMGKAERVRGKAFRTHGRAMAILDAVDEAELSPEERDRLMRRKDRFGLDIVREEQLAQMQRALPTNGEVPSVPKRG